MGETTSEDIMLRGAVDMRYSPLRTVKPQGYEGNRVYQLDSTECFALPDSGAEPNLLSYKYAEARGWLLDMLQGPESCRLLQFADGSMVIVQYMPKFQGQFRDLFVVVELGDELDEEGLVSVAAYPCWLLLCATRGMCIDVE